MTRTRTHKARSVRGARSVRNASSPRDAVAEVLTFAHTCLFAAANDGPTEAIVNCLYNAALFAEAEGVPETFAARAERLLIEAALAVAHYPHQQRETIAALSAAVSLVETFRQVEPEPVTYEEKTGLIGGF